MPRLRFFRMQETGNAIDLFCEAGEITKEVESEASALFAMIFYQTRNHIRLDLNRVEHLPMSFVTRILNLGVELREKKRVLALVGIPLSLYHFLRRFRLQKIFFLPKGCYRSPSPSHSLSSNLQASPDKGSGSNEPRNKFQSNPQITQKKENPGT